jgi:SAM-dependent methyltransferase
MEAGMKRWYKRLQGAYGQAAEHLDPSGPYHYRHVQSKKRYARYMRQKLGHFMAELDQGPIGDEEIILRTAVLNEGEVAARVDPNFYFWTGYSQMLSWLQQLDRFSFNLRSVQAIMELGCGSARLIRHLRCIDGIRLIGTDVKPEFVDWCRSNIPGIEFYVNDLQPPISFLENDSLDLVFAASVFTHIPLEFQGAWIEELYRIVRPGGFLLASVLGREHQRAMLDAEDEERLKKEGQLTLDSTDDKASLSTKMIGSWDVFQTRGQVLKAFGTQFHVCDYVPGKQDLLVLQKQGTG